uniref:Uncharacterized protein n=1 Tax=Lotus japonicus TaxID=34305 RepID=I3S9F0_LOTJA|nr:unknown [Lotus japonicus]
MTNECVTQEELNHNNTDNIKKKNVTKIASAQIKLHKRRFSEEKAKSKSNKRSKSSWNKKSSSIRCGTWSWCLSG